MMEALTLSFFAALVFYGAMDWFIHELNFDNRSSQEVAVEFSLAAAAFFGVAVFLMLKEYM